MDTPDHYRLEIVAGPGEPLARVTVEVYAASLTMLHEWTNETMAFALDWHDVATMLQQAWRTAGGDKPLGTPSPFLDLS